MKISIMLSVFIVNVIFCVDMQVNDDHVPEETDEDDENDENNWRNDYPDEDEFLPEEDSDGETGVPVTNTCLLLNCARINLIPKKANE